MRFHFLRTAFWLLVFIGVHFLPGGRCFFFLVSTKFISWSSVLVHLLYGPGISWEKCAREWKRKRNGEEQKTPLNQNRNEYFYLVYFLSVPCFNSRRLSSCSVQRNFLFSNFFFLCFWLFMLFGINIWAKEKWNFPLWLLLMKRNWKSETEWPMRNEMAKKSNKKNNLKNNFHVWDSWNGNQVTFFPVFVGVTRAPSSCSHHTPFHTIIHWPHNRHFFVDTVRSFSLHSHQGIYECTSNRSLSSVAQGY